MKKFMHDALAYRWQTFNPMVKELSDNAADVSEQEQPKQSDGWWAKLSAYKEKMRMSGRNSLPDSVQNNADQLVVAGQLVGHIFGAMSGYFMKNPYRLGVAGAAVPITFLSIAGEQAEETPEEAAKIDNMGVLEYAGYRLKQSVDFLSPEHLGKSQHRRQLLGLVNIGIGIGIFMAGTCVKHNKSITETIGTSLNFASGGTLLFGRNDDKSWQNYGMISSLNAPMQVAKTAEMWTKYRDYSYVAMSTAYILGNALAFFVGDNAKELPDKGDIPPVRSLEEVEKEIPKQPSNDVMASRGVYHKRLKYPDHQLDCACALHV